MGHLLIANWQWLLDVYEFEQFQERVLYIANTTKKYEQKILISTPFLYNIENMFKFNK